jgi:hypothetical protein
MRSADTSPEAQNKHGELLRQMTPEPKLQRAFSLSRLARSCGEGGLRERYPQASERQSLLRPIRQKWGLALFRQEP